MIKPILGETKLISIKEPDRLNEKWAARLEIMIRENFDSFGGKKKNYLKDNLALDQHFCFHVSVSRKTDEIIAGCGVFNGGRYPNGVFRVLNRAFISPRFRQKNKPSGLLAKTILPTQMELYQPDLKCIFVSREGKNGNQFLKFWVDNYAPGGKNFWMVTDQLVHVQPKGFNQKCFQYIAVQKSGMDSWKPRSISLKEWHELTKG